MPDLNVHIASVHEGKKPFKCEICYVQFEVENELNEHMCHSCEKPATHFCKSCDQNLCKHHRSLQKYKFYKES